MTGPGRGSSRQPSSGSVVAGSRARCSPAFRGKLPSSLCRKTSLARPWVLSKLPPGQGRNRVTPTIKCESLESNRSSVFNVIVPQAICITHAVLSAFSGRGGDVCLLWPLLLTPLPEIARLPPPCPRRWQVFPAAQRAAGEMREMHVPKPLRQARHTAEPLGGPVFLHGLK